MDTAPTDTGGSPATARQRQAARRRLRAAAAARYRQAPKLARPAPQSRPALSGAGILGSALVHGALLLLILTWKSRPPFIEPNAPVEIAVVEREKPPPPPPPEPPKVEEKKPEPPKVARVRPKVLPPPPKEAPPPPPDLKEDLPPPPNEQPPKDAKPQAPVMIGISMSSTTTGGSFAAPVGNSLYGNAPKVAPKPEDVHAYASPTGRYVPPYKVAELPVVLTEIKAEYPAEARKLGLEGQVVLRVTVDATGKVAAAKVVKGIGHGFDESALEAMRRFKFKPGTDAGEAIVTEITYTITFLLD